jgi:cytoskeletal protein RodZ
MGSRNIAAGGALGRMGLFAGLMTYLVAAALLVGSAVISVSTLLSSPAETTEASSATKAPGKLVRTTERKPEAPKPEASKSEASKAAVSPQSAAAPLGPAVNHMPANPPRLGNAERAKKQAQSSQPARKKKIARPAPQEPKTATATLGYGPEQRRFVFPMDPGW